MTAQAPELAETLSGTDSRDSRDWTFGGTWPYQPKWLSTDGVRIHYVDEGARGGEPVVMLHAPHPSWASRAGVLAYPRLIPWEAGHITAPLGAHIEDNLERLSGKPILIVWPGQDRGFKQSSLAFWRARFPDADVHEIEDAGHYIQEDAHEHVIPLLLDFLERT